MEARVFLQTVKALSKGVTFLLEYLNNPDSPLSPLGGKNFPVTVAITQHLTREEVV
jgi:hypothetical protein